jgi:hypothetical protein
MLGGAPHLPGKIVLRVSQAGEIRESLSSEVFSELAEDEVTT